MFQLSFDVVEQPFNTLFEIHWVVQQSLIKCRCMIFILNSVTDFLLLCPPSPHQSGIYLGNIIGKLVLFAHIHTVNITVIILCSAPSTEKVNKLESKSRRSYARDK